MVQDLNDQGKSLNICIIQSTASKSLEQLATQNYSFNLLVAGYQHGKEVSQIRQISCLKDGLRLPDEEKRFLELASLTSVKWIISNVTEAGMVMKKEGPMEQFAESFAGRLTQWLYRRFQTIPDCETVILPCELLPNNGDLLKNFILSHSKIWGLPSEFFSWIDSKVIFHNSLVDRIVPGFPSHLDLKEKEADPFLVQAEPYSLWAIEGKESDQSHLPFLSSRSEVVLAEDISGYSLRKVRILNASHTAMTGHGLLLGIETVGDWIADEEREKFLFDMIREEIIPTIPIDEHELISYGNEVLDRFRNPFVAHKLSDISLNSIAKIKSRLLPVLEDYQNKTSHLPPRLTLCLVALILFYLRNPSKIRDDQTVKEWFDHRNRETSELENLQSALSTWLNLEWNPALQNAFNKLTQ
jgi:tagaturonate reductase